MDDPFGVNGAIGSKIPAELRDGTSLRFIEVKGRAKGATSVTVTKNEILTALNEPEQYILAIAEVDGESVHVVYLKKPFRKRPDFATTSVNYDIAELINGAETVYNDQVNKMRGDFMIRSVSFQNFRGFKKLELPDLAQITLLSGKNNAGKSTVLEGIFLLADRNDRECFTKICNFRSLPAIPNFDILWKPLFYQLNVDEPFQISARLEHNTELTYYREDSYSPLPYDLKGMTPDVMNRFISSAQNGHTLGFHLTQEEISYTETGHFIVASDGIFLNVDTSLPNDQMVSMPLTQIINSTITAFQSPVELFGKLELDGRKNEVLQILKKMDQNISDITTITTNGQTQLYGNMCGKLLPMRLAGDGMNRLLFIMLTIMENSNSILLIDEIENGFHYSMYPAIWEAIANAAQKSNCQVIATTHSYECVAGAVEGIKKADMKDDFCFFRLAQEKEGRVAYRYSQDLLQYALESDVEVR